MKIATAPGRFFFTCIAPWTSISRTRFFRLERASSSQRRGVPYQFLPKTCAYSRNSPDCFMRSNSSSDTKLYHLPRLSVWRGGRVVHETDSSVLGRSRMLWTSVDLPEPEGPETMKTSGSALVAIATLDFGPVLGVFRSR